MGQKNQDKRQKTKDKRQLNPKPIKWSMRHSGLPEPFKWSMRHPVFSGLQTYFLAPYFLPLFSRTSTSDFESFAG